VVEGEPRVSDADRYRKPLTIYPTPALRAAIEAEAEEQRRSLSQVVQFKLEAIYGIKPEPVRQETKPPVKLSLRPRA
jgi:hypothetical protein